MTGAVCGLYKAGYSPKEIGAMLKITKNTVNNCRRRGGLTARNEKLSAAAKLSHANRKMNTFFDAESEPAPEFVQKQMNLPERLDEENAIAALNAEIKKMNESIVNMAQILEAFINGYNVN